MLFFQFKESKEIEKVTRVTMGKLFSPIVTPLTNHVSLQHKSKTVAMETPSFEQLPHAVARIFLKLQELEQLILIKQAPPKEADEQLTVQQAALFLNLSVSTIYGKVCRSEIPVNKKGKRLYFYKSELLAWVKAGRKKTKEEIEKEMILTRNNKTRNYP